MTTKLPSALSRLESWEKWLSSKKTAVFLDYDGVLTPIVRRPEEAHISEGMRKAVMRLSALCPVAIVSGRDLPDVRNLAAIPGIVYAGSHGFDIECPGGESMKFRKGADYLPLLDRAEGELERALSGVRGVRVERKKFAIAVHFREVPEDKVPRIEGEVDERIRKIPGLRKTGGKKIFELRPDIDWDKGRAVEFLLEKLDLDTPEYVPLYIGDDVTDEDAFRVLREYGIGVVVHEKDERPTLARYALKDTEEVRRFLRGLAKMLERNPC